MEYLPFYLGGFGILVLGLLSFAWYQNERLKKRFIEEACQGLCEGTSVPAIEQQLTGHGLEIAPARKLIELAQHRMHVQRALELLEQGKTEEEVKTILVEAGVQPDLADEFIGSAQFTKFCHDRPILSMTLGIVMPLVGLAIIVGGVLLWLGNKSGRFVTFPFAGQAVIVIGVVIFAGGIAFLVRSMKS